MTRQEIVEDLAQRRVVEEMCKNIAHYSELTPDLKDLSQIVYIALLTFDEEKIVDLWETDALGFFIARIIKNQYNSKTSTFFRQVRKFRLRSDEFNAEIIDGKEDK